MAVNWRKSFWYLTLILKISGFLGVVVTFYRDSASAQILHEELLKDDSSYLNPKVESNEQVVDMIENVTVQETNLSLSNPKLLSQIDATKTDFSQSNQLFSVLSREIALDRPVTLTNILSQSPNPIPPRNPEQPTPQPQPLPRNPLEPPPTIPSSPERPVLPGTITVTRFEFEGNTAFSDQELTEVTVPFTNRLITFAELLQAEAAVTKLYTSAGYINSGAVIPANQTLSLKGAIQVIEGGVKEIEVTGTRRLNSNYVHSRLALATDRPLNQNRLLEALQLLQLDPLIQNLSAELSAGSSPELSVLSVRVQEADSFNTEFFADNGRAPSVGNFRRGIRFNQANLLGLVADGR